MDQVDCAVRIDPLNQGYVGEAVVSSTVAVAVMGVMEEGQITGVGASAFVD